MMDVEQFYNLDTFKSDISPNLLIYLPEPLDVEEDGDRFRIVTRIPVYQFEPNLISPPPINEYVARSWQNMYSQLIMKAAQLMLGRDEYYVLKFYLEVLRSPAAFDVDLRLSMNIFVALTHEIGIPEFIYDPVETNMVIEWRCGYCNSPNLKEERFCSQCGAGRALLIQEL